MQQKLILIFLKVTAIIPLWSISSFGQKNIDNVIIKGNIVNISNQIELEDMSAVGRISASNPERYFLPDSLGNFSIKTHVKSPGYFRLGRNIIYLSPGDNINVQIDFNLPEKAKFEGSNWKLNDYLKNTAFPKAGSYCEYSSLIKSTVNETIDAFVDYGKKRHQSLLALPDASPLFIELEEARIKADIINSIVSLTWFYPERHKLSMDSSKRFQQTFMPQIGKLIEPFINKFVNSDYLDLVVYQKIAGYVIKYNKQDSASTSSLTIKEWITASSIFAEMNYQYENADFEKINDRINLIVKEEYRYPLLEFLKSKSIFANGSQAQDFAALNINKKSVKLSDLKGKVILLDFWATWCGPCIQAFPQIEAIKQYFINDSNVVIQSVSIDENTAKWESAVSKYNLGKNTWIINRYAIPEYQLYSLPRIVIVDKNFRVASFSGFEPSDKEGLIQFIEKLLIE